MVQALWIMEFDGSERQPQLCSAFFGAVVFGAQVSFLIIWTSDLDLFSLSLLVITMYG